MRDVAKQPIQTLVENIKSRQLRSIDVVDAFYKRLQKIQPVINCVTQFADHEEVLRAAETADRAALHGQANGMLHGIPLTVKDAMQLRHYVCAKGSTGLKQLRATKDSTVVQRLRNAGAIIIGQTNVPELLLAYETDNDVYGRTLNPHNLHFSAGGSSGGEAAAIAAGGSPAGMASDAAGSVRIPAHYCGVAGLKVTQGRIPATGGVPRDGAGVSSRFSSYGMLARWVDDLQILLQVVAGADDIDPYCPPVALDLRQDNDLSVMRIAYFTDLSNSHVQQEISAAIMRCVEVLTGVVEKCVYDKPSCFENAYELLFETLLLGGDEGQSWRDVQTALNIARPSKLFSDFMQRAERVSFSLTEFRHRLVKIDRYCIDMLAFMQDYDLIICPVSAKTAQRHGEVMHHLDDFTYSMAFSLTGWPVIVVPVGKDNEGLPIGIQIAAKPWREKDAFIMARFLEETLGGWNEFSAELL